MKRTSFKVFGYLALAVAISACSGLNKMKKNAPDVTYSVTPEVLEAHGGKVDLGIKVRIPGGYFDKKTVLEGTPVLKYDGGETAFPSYKVQGESVKGNDQTISKSSGGQVSYQNTVPYSDGMRVSDLVVRIKATRGSKEVIFDDYKIAEGVISTSGLVSAKGIEGNYGKDKFQRIIPFSQGAEILFLIQQASLRSTELAKEDVKALNEFIKTAQQAENKEFKGIEISGYASPEGPTDLNTKLAAQRESAAKGVIDGELKKNKVDASASGFFNLKNTPEDWEGFRTLVSASNIQDKDLILRVLSMYTDPDVREKEIKNMSSTYKVLADEILPKLRRSKMNVNVEEIGKSDAEITSIAKSDPSQLSLEELLYGATLTTDIDQQLAIYRAAANKFPDDWRTHNNVGYALYQKDDLDGAKVAFEKANSVKANQPEVMNNLGAIELRRGDIAKAEEYFGNAAGAGTELDNNLGIVALFKGQYEEAVRYFGNSTSNNAALAKILTGKYDAALSTLNANTVEDGLKYYLKAIVGVRTNDADMMFSNLRKATQLEGSYKKYAATDMEFAKYFKDATFLSIVQ
jgi:Flp pilus assembly protein TadD